MCSRTDMRYDLSTILKFKVPWNPDKIDLYVDVDGVICCPYTRDEQADEKLNGLSTHYQLRPDVTGFLRRMVQIYNVKWLTTESEDDVRGLFASTLQAAPDLLGIEFAEWGSLMKLTGVNINRPFWILDDCLDGKSQKWLKGNDMLHRWIKVDGHEVWELARIEGQLQRMEQDILTCERRIVPPVSFIKREIELRAEWKERQHVAEQVQGTVGSSREA